MKIVSSNKKVILLLETIKYCLVFDYISNLKPAVRLWL